MPVPHDAQQVFPADDADQGAVFQYRQDQRDKDIDKSKFMNQGTIASQDLVPTFNSLEEAEALPLLDEAAKATAEEGCENGIRLGVQGEFA